MDEKALAQGGVVVVDDDPAWCNALRLALRTGLGLAAVVAVNDSRQALAVIEKQKPQLVLLDVTMPHVGGEKILEQMVRDFPEIPVIMITGRSEVDLAIRCMKLGAFDYFMKTDEDERLLAGVSHALEFVSLQDQNRKLKERFLSTRLTCPDAFSDIVTANDKMLSIFRYVEAIADSREPLLIVGETGVGKELIARAVHQCGRSTAASPWVAVNVAGLDDAAFSDTLFGHVRGAFTGADRLRQGLVEKARGGVVFLDEIGDLPADSQVKLLRFIQEGEYYPLGSDQPKKADVRLVFATNHDLQDNVDAGHFRKDLYYRLKVHQVRLPPLRERADDIPLLLEYYLDEAARQLDKPAPKMAASLVDTLKGYRFPGNVRELRGVMFAAVSASRTQELGIDDFDIDLACMGRPADASSGLSGTDATVGNSPERFPTINQSVDALVEEAMRRAGGNQSVAAGMLGITQSALSRRLKKMRQGKV